MEPTLLISDDFLNSTSLEHYGVKGMKWGKWNDETRAKYMGGKGRTISAKVKELGDSGKSAVKAFADKKVSEVKASREAKKENRKQIKQQRKELGMSRAKFDKLRDTTLKSHDPRVVERGMQTLTDMELDEKLNRLRKEEQISRMASDKATRKHNENKARSEAIKANPIYSVGMNVAGRAIKKVFGEGGQAAVNAAKNVANKATNAAKNSSGKSESSGDKQKVSWKKAAVRDYGPKNSNSSRQSGTSDKHEPRYSSGSVEADWGSNSRYGTRVNRKVLPAQAHGYTKEEHSNFSMGYEQRKARDKAAYNSWKASSTQAKEAAEKGKAYVDDIIDVTPSEASSDRHGKQK